MHLHVVNSGWLVWAVAGICLLTTVENEIFARQVQSGESTDSAIVREIETMTLEEKVGQLFYIHIGSHFLNEDSEQFNNWVKTIQSYHIGGVSVYGGSMYAAAQNILRLQKISERPLLVVSTLEWGLPMRLSAGTRFPENMAIGATGNPEYAYRQGKIIAREMRAVGFHVNFAPVVDVNNNPDNPIINVRSYGEDPAMVSRFGVRFLEGLQEGGIAASAKHYPGHGDTGTDSHLLLPTVPVDRARLDSVELVPFKAAIDAGSKMIMTAHIALTRLRSGKTPATLSPFILKNILRDSLGFEGVVITDAMMMGGIVKGYWPGEAAVKALQAGSDMILYSPDVKLAYETVLDAVKAGRITEKQIDESLHRVLKLKRELNVEQNRYPDMDRVNRVLEDPASMMFAKQMFQKSLTLVKDSLRAVPLDAGEIDSMTVVVLTDEIRRGFPGSTLLEAVRKRVENTRVYHIGPNPSDQLLHDAGEAIARSDAAIIGTIVQFRDHKGSIGLPKKQADWLNNAMYKNENLITVGFGNPYLLRYFPDTPAYLTTFSVAAGAQQAAVEGIFGEQEITGTLPISLPSGYPVGHGLRRAVEHNAWVELPDTSRFSPVFNLIEQGISDSVAPGMAVYIARQGTVHVARGFGRLTYKEQSPAVTKNTIFDLASLTKVTATLPIAMRMYEKNLLHLDKPISSYLPEFKGGLKDSARIRHLFTHEAGLKPFIPFWKELNNPDQRIKYMSAEPLIYSPGDSTVYSDLGFILLGEILEKLGRKSLNQLARDILFEPLTMVNTHFNPGDSLMAQIAPTEFDHHYRNRQIHGEVHDENAAFAGGVSGHAGLFSTVEDLGRYAQLLLSNGYLDGHKIFTSSTIETFTSHADKIGYKKRALGWKMIENSDPTFGTHFSGKAFGHTGFTGTSIAIDPEYETIIILLTNRVYPSRENTKIYSFRRLFHDAVMKELLGLEIETDR